MNPITLYWLCAPETSMNDIAVPAAFDIITASPVNALNPVPPCATARSLTNVSVPTCKPAGVPENTSDEFVAACNIVNPEAESSQPMKPTLADPSLYLNSTPRSLLSSELDEPEVPNVIIGSSKTVTELFTVVVVPCTVKLPVIVVLAN